MTPESLEAWKLTQSITSQTFEDLVKSKEDRTLQKVTTFLLGQIGMLILDVNKFASRRLIIEVLGTFVERLKVEEELELKHGPPPSSQDMLEEYERKMNPPTDDGDPSDGGPESRVM